MRNLILHIPHSSTSIPFVKGFIVEKELIEKDIMKLTDWYTDDLFSLEGAVVVRADFSRVFCDTERFSDDSEEMMAKYGMGVLYEKLDDGSVFREVTPELREEILNGYYWPHHEILNGAVDEQLGLIGKALIVDCHSFPSKPHARDLNKVEPRPDFNIGIDSFHTPDYLVELSKDFFEERNYSVGVNWPYSGSIVPLSHYRKSKGVASIMLEINRALYINEPGNEKAHGYMAIKEMVAEYLVLLKDSF